MYEPATARIITCNGASHDLSVIDPKTEKVLQTIPVGGKPEAAVPDRMGNVYVNIEDKNEIVKVNMRTFKVEARWSLNGGEGPTGLAIDINTRRLFAGCEKLLVVMNTENGEVVAKVPIGDRCDGVVFDPAAGMIYTANGEGTITAIQESDADHFSVVENFPTKRGARTIAMDLTQRLLFMPTADFDETKKDANGRPALKPGSFRSWLCVLCKKLKLLKQDVYKFCIT